MNPLNQLVGEELASRLLTHFKTLSRLARATTADLEQVPGIGPAKARQLRAAFELSAAPHQESISLQTPEQAYEWVRSYFAGLEIEQMGVILQDAKAVAQHFEVVSRGTLTQTLIHPREVFFPAIYHRAASFILVHNHPSGDPIPSAEDLTQTKRLIECSKLLGVMLNDHLILGRGSYYSMRMQSTLWRADHLLGCKIL